MRENENVDGTVRWWIRQIVGSAFLLGAFLTTGSALRADGPQRTGDDLLVVDCLLPPQVRQLGKSTTYLSARKPVRTTARDCQIRGGEYVAYDRASLKSSLKVWMPLAENGRAQIPISYLLCKSAILGLSFCLTLASWSCTVAGRSCIDSYGKSPRP